MSNILRQLIRETLLTEAAMTPVQASELGIRFQVRRVIDDHMWQDEVVIVEPTRITTEL